MELTIYIDVLWLRTFFVELNVCLFVNLWMKQECTVIRILWVNALASAAQILLFVLTGYGAAVMLGGLFLRACVICFLFRPRTAGIFVRLFFWGMAATAAAGGILGAAQSHLPQSCWFAAGSVLCAGSILVSLVFEERRTLHDRRLYRVTLYQGEKTVEVMGLYDTGNRLIDPYVHMPVYILAGREYQQLTGDTRTARFIPFVAVGTKNQMMEVTTVDALECSGDRQTPVVVGRADDEIFDGKDYRMILPAAWSAAH